MKKFAFIFAAIFTAVIFAPAGTAAADKAPPKYVFLFIGDGMSLPQRSAAEEFMRRTGQPGLAINAMPVQAMTRTCSANSQITDSAAAATAIACGVKTNNGTLGLDPAGNILESSAVAAQKSGRKVGIVTSVTINNATPAGFYAHRKKRGELYSIGHDLIASGFDYFGGGGLSGKGDNKKHPQYSGDIYTLAEKAGYKVVAGKAELLALKPGSGKVFARAGEYQLPFAIDYSGDNANLPTLADFTAKGVELLDNPKGFFLMVEGGLIDHAGHNNDAASNIREVIDLDKSVRVALDFASKHPQETLIIVTGDHETGGMTLGYRGHTFKAERLVRQKCSISRFHELLKHAREANKEFSFDDAAKMITGYFGLEFSGNGEFSLNEAEKKQLQKAFESKNLANAVKDIMNAKAGVGWSTGGHSGIPVITTAIGCQAERFGGWLDNTDLSKQLKELFAE